MTTVLVTGAGGQLGRDLVNALHTAGHDPVGVTHAQFDVAAGDAAALLDAARPAVVVNCAAWTAVDACEADPDRAMAVNGTAVERLAAACAERGIRLVQISTDYVFDGTLDRPYEEDDEPNPLSAYGRSKLAGERAALGLGVLGTVVRTSWVFSDHGGNMYATIARLMDSGTPLRFVNDQHGCPTYTPDLAHAIVQLIGAEASGIVHVTNEGATTWYGFAQAVVAARGGDPSKVQAISTADLDPPRPAPRPANSVLASGPGARHGLAPLRHFTAALTELATSGSDHPAT